MRAESSAGDTRRLFHTASALYDNFYEKAMVAVDVAGDQTDVEALLVRIRSILA